MYEGCFYFSYSKRPGRSKYNPVYEFPYDINGRNCQMVVTSVTGHLTDNDFPEPYNKGWSLCDPLELFTMEIKTFVPEVLQSFLKVY